MAGFAVFMTIITYGLIGIVVASVTSLVLYFVAKWNLEIDGLKNPKLVTLNAIAPFLGLGWLVFALLIHVAISNNFAHQDCGLSGDPYVTLPNGYQVGSNNTYDGYILAPGFRTDVPVAGPGYVRSIINLHLVGDKFIGTQFDFKTSTVRRFTFDTRTREFQSAPLGPSSWNAANDQAQLDTDSYWKLYYQYRHHWPNYILCLLIIAGESALCFVVWKAWTNRLRAQSVKVPE
jgi:hypothetical protein